MIALRGSGWERQERERRTFSPEYKTDAVKLWRGSGEPKDAIAKRLGVHGTTLGNWTKKADIDDGKREGTSTVDKERIAELEKKLKVVTMERRNRQKLWIALPSDYAGTFTSVG